jgi:acylphosphatase
MKEQAEKRGLFGWVRNASNGSVEAFIQGEDESLNDLLAFSWDGPDLADVEDILTQDTKVDDSFNSFDIH